MDTMTAHRPPRPHIPAPELLALAKEHGLAPESVDTVRVSPDGDTIVESITGIRWRIVEPGNPDGDGRVGLLLEHHPKGYKMRAPDFTPRPSSEPWLLSDFDWLADKLTPTSSGVEDGWGGYAGWLKGGHHDLPVRCYALWRSRGRGQTMAESARGSTLCARLRSEVLAAGWLAESEAAKL